VKNLKTLPQRLLAKILAPVDKLLDKEVDRLADTPLLDEESNSTIDLVMTYSISFIVLVFFIWAYNFEIHEVSFAPGIIKTNESVVKVHILQSNTVKEIFVKEGQLVKQNQKLISFDDTLYQNELELNLAKQENLQRKLELVEEQLQIRKELYSKGLNSKIIYLNIMFKQKELKGTIIETEMKISSLRGQIDTLSLYATVTGYIHALNRHNKGDVVSPEVTIMEIIPSNLKLIAEVKISPDDIGQISLDQNVIIKLNTYDFSKYGGIFSTLSEVSPMTIPQREGESFYKGIVNIPNNKSTALKIIPGMTLNAEIRTGSKTMLKYIFGPIFKSAKNAFKEK
jgi:multidrug efflux pump subunit AcrA (membrane-fusion protein)